MEVHCSRQGGKNHANAPRYIKIRGLLGKFYGPMFRGAHWFLRRSGLYARGARNALDIQRTAFELRLKGLPAGFDGYRILHLSDLHLDMIDGLDHAIAIVTKGLSVDLCVMTGDYRSRFFGPFDHVVDAMKDIMSGIESRDGFLVTLGNHDEHAMADAFEAISLLVLVNESVLLERGGSFIHLTGVDDVNRFYTPAADAALSLPEGAYGIVLVHSPEMAAAAAEAGYGLYLCGHTHGGQICLPGGIPVIVNLKRHYFYSKGLWKHGAMRGYTSRGAGLCGLPARFFSRGEITVITLRAI